MPSYSKVKVKKLKGYKSPLTGYKSGLIVGTGGTKTAVAPPPPPKPLAPRPPAPPSPKPQPLPFDPTYESTVGNARRQYDTTLAGLAYQEGRTRQDYGFDDASDPFSRARMLERNFQQATRGRLNTAGNNLYSSSFNRGESEGRRGYEQNVNTERKSYADALQAFTQQRAQALTDKTGIETSAAAERVRRAQEDREAAALFAAQNAPPPAPPKPKPKAAPKPKAKPKKKPPPKKKPKKGKQVKFGKKKLKGYK